MAHLSMRFPDGKKKALTLSYDDGVEQDIRLISILKQYGLKGTFNLNSGCYPPKGTTYAPGTIHRRMCEEQVTEVYRDSGMEVAVHGLTHPFLEQLPSNLCLAEVAKDRENLEKQFGTLVRGMAYPFGTYSDNVVEVLKQCGIAYSRTVISTGDFRIPSDWHRLTATCHHKDERLMGLAEKFVEEKKDSRYGPWLFYLWGHSYEFESDNNWEVIEKFAQYTGGRDDIWYATNIEVYDYIEAYRKLIFSMDETRVSNPTALDLYFKLGEKEVCVPAGKTVEI